MTLGHGAVIHSQLVDDYAVIGMGAITSIRSKIGRWTIVAEGAIVKMEQTIPDGVVVAGNPAKIARKVAEKDIEHWTWGKQLYVDLAKKYLAEGMHEVKIEL